MRTVFEPSDRSSLLARIDRLTPDSAPRWGRMSVGQMLAHLVESVRMATGELTCRPRSGPLAFPPLRWLIVNWLPFPKGAPTAPELLRGTPPDDLAAVRERLDELLEQVARLGPSAEYPRHPAFGVMPGRQWGILIYRHFDHHLRQFGV